MSDDEPRIPQVETLSIDEIRNYRTSSSTIDRDKAIRQAADRQFSTVLKNIDAVDFIAEFAAEEVNDYDYWDANDELKDSDVLDYLHRITALRIKYNRQYDDYRQKNPEDDMQQEEQKQIDLGYQAEARSIYKQMLSYPHDAELEKIKRQHPSVVDYEEDDAEPVPRDILNRYLKLEEEQTYFYYGIDSSRLKIINVDAYIALASRIGEASSVRDEELFLTYLHDFIIRTPSDEPTPPDTEKEEGIPPKEQELLKKLKEVENKARAYIFERYHTKLPEIVYEKFQQDMNAMRDFLLTSEEKPFLQQRGHFAYIREKDSVSALDNNSWGEANIPNQLHVRYDTSDSFINNAETVFEELYHASGLPLQQKEAEKYWPGWRDDGTESFFEEGLTAAEMRRFFEKNYKEEYHASGSRNDIIVRYLQGENVSGYNIKDIWPEVLMETLINNLGKSSLRLMRSARANEPGSIEALEETIDDTLGEGTFDMLSRTDAKDRDKILTIIRKWKE
jgi:hypothetical protein